MKVTLERQHSIPPRIETSLGKEGDRREEWARSYPDEETREKSELVQDDHIPALLSLKSLFGLLRRQYKTIAITTLTLIILTLFAVISATNYYTASTLVMLDLRNARLVDPSAAGALSADGEVELLRSGDMAIDVVKRLKLYDLPEFVPEAGWLDIAISEIIGFIASFVRDGSEDDGSNATDDNSESAPPDGGSYDQPRPEGFLPALRTLKNSVEIRRRGLTDVIAIEVTSTSPRRAALIANTYAEVYLDKQVAAKLKSIDRAEASLMRRLREMDEELKRSEAQVGLRQTYQDSLLRLKAVSQQRDAIGPDARVISSALPPQVSSSPRRGMLLILSAVAGLGLGVGIGYLRDSSSRRVASEEDVEMATGTAVLASVPRIRAGSRASEPQDHVLAEPMSAHSEAVRKLLFTLQLVSRRRSKLGTFLITSTDPQDGKSTLALSLAQTATLAGVRTAVVDCNLRNRELYTLIYPGGPFAEDQAKAATYEAPVLALAAAVHGRTAANEDAHEHLADRRLKVGCLVDTLRVLEAEYDLVILDAPALTPYADVLLLLQHVHTVIYTARASVTKMKDLRLGVQNLRRLTDANIFTVLMLNRSKV